jgi:hypothetical protein
MDKAKSNHSSKRQSIKQKYAFIGIILFLFYLLLISNCSHSSVYIREGVSPVSPGTPIAKEVQTRLLLIGDAGEPLEVSGLIMEGLVLWGKKIPEKTTIIFLGDNIYTNGLPEKGQPGREEAESRILPQIHAVQASGGRGIFIPGNHDWRATGQARIIAQQEFVQQHLPAKESFLPRFGCPGPEYIDLPGARVIILDTEWWLRSDSPSTDSCRYQTPEEVVAALEELVAGAGDKEVVITGHHPFVTAGPHGGYFTWKDHLFPLTNVKEWLWLPLPIIGSLYPIGRWNFVKNNQDLNGPLNKKMVTELSEVLAKSKPLAYAAGHEHNLQVHEGGEVVSYFLVSGAGAKTTNVWHKDETVFSHSERGFMALDFMIDNSVLLRIIEPGHPENEGVVFQMWLKE